MVFAAHFPEHILLTCVIRLRLVRSPTTVSRKIARDGLREPEHTDRRSAQLQANG